MNWYTDSVRPTGREWCGLAGLCLVVLVFYLLALNCPLQRCDDIYFYIGAKSIAAGKGLCDISRPDMPLLTKYGPLPSLIASPFINSFGTPGEARHLRLVSLALLLLLTPAYYRFLRERTSHFGTLLLIALFLLNPVTMMGVMLMPGATGFIPLIAVIFLLLERRPAGNVPTTLASDLRQALPLVAVLAAGFYVHKTYIIAAVSVVVYLVLFWKRPRQAAIVAIGVLLIAMPWMIRSHAATGHWISAEYEAEINGRIIADTPAGAASGVDVGGTIRHALINLRDMPVEVAHGMWPWSRGSGQTVWPALQRVGIGWVPNVILCLVFALVLVGAIQEWRVRRAFAEWHLLPHTLMLLFFFVAFQYYGYFLPLLFLYLWRGFGIVTGSLLKVPSRRRAIAITGFVILLLPSLGKDLYNFVARSTAGMHEREQRWSWVSEQIPEGEAVYWENLGDYAWACWRWFDSGRLAAGIRTDDMEAALSGSNDAIHYVSVARNGAWASRLRAAGWEPIYTEPDTAAPSPELIARLAPHIAVAQRDYLASLPPVQTLWRRPTRVAQ